MIDKEAWAEDAYFELRKYARHQRHNGRPPWTVETLRKHITRCALLENPPELRWWGEIVQRALREKIIIPNGWGIAKSSHGSPKRRYVGSKWA